MKNQTLNNAFPIVAAALGNKFGVNVRVGGEDAFTDGKSINLPAYNLEDPSYKDVAWGYLAHEAAHVRFTEFEAFAKAATSPIRKTIVNILEDTRIEKLMQETYPGTKRTIEKVVEHLIQTAGFEIAGMDQVVHPATILGQFLLFRLRNDVLGQTALSLYANLSESLLEETFPAGAVTRLAGLLSEVPQLQVTRDCVRLADRILRMIEEELENEQEKSIQLQQQQPSQQGCDDSSLQPQSGQSDADQDLPADSKPDNPDQDQNQGQSQSSQQSDADGDDQDQQPGQGGSNVAGSRTDNSQSQDSEQLAQTLASVLSAGEDDVPDDLFEVVQQILGSQPQHCYRHSAPHQLKIH